MTDARTLTSAKRWAVISAVLLLVGLATANLRWDYWGIPVTVGVVGLAYTLVQIASESRRRD